MTKGERDKVREINSKDIGNERNRELKDRKTVSKDREAAKSRKRMRKSEL